MYCVQYSNKANRKKDRIKINVPGERNAGTSNRGPSHSWSQNPSQARICLFAALWPVALSLVPERHSSYLCALANMGRVRTKTVKKASRVMIERYYSRMMLDFQTNKKIAEEVAIIPSKRLRNKIAGFATHLMKRIQRGPVRGISLKLQEEERERRMDFVPEESAIKTDVIEVDRETIELLAHLNMPQLPGVVQQTAPATGGFFKPQVGGFQGNRNRN